MEQQQKTNSFKKLLDRLQEDSWQLELLISGFAIFGLFSALEPVANATLEAQFNKNTFFIIFLIITYFSLKVLIFNLLVHILLRGLWIGSLGLRSVFGDIDFDKLNYSELFTKYLKKKIVSFDTYINRLENFCSIIFALTFLLVFYIFSFFIVIAIAISLDLEVPDWMIFIIRIIFILFVLGAILTFFDFITQGLLKKNEKVAKVYFPFYWLFSFLTLSFLYRPIAYNLLDNKYGRKVSLGLLPFYMIIYIVFHLDYQKSNFITSTSTERSSEIIANGSNYEDIIAENEYIFIKDFAIPSKVITDAHLKVVIPVSQEIEDVLIELNPNLKPEKDNRGLYFKSEVSFVNMATERNDDMVRRYLDTFEAYYRFKIDSIVYKTDFVISNINESLSLESYINIDSLSEGKHTIKFEHSVTESLDSFVSIQQVPFWYYRN